MCPKATRKPSLNYLMLLIILILILLILIPAPRNVLIYCLFIKIPKCTCSITSTIYNIDRMTRASPRPTTNTKTRTLVFCCHKTCALQLCAIGVIPTCFILWGSELCTMVVWTHVWPKCLKLFSIFVIIFILSLKE
jgi:hypothetical protein